MSSALNIIYADSLSWDLTKVACFNGKHILTFVVSTFHARLYLLNRWALCRLQLWNGVTRGIWLNRSNEVGMNRSSKINM